jgi:hypothetical protein
VATRTPAEAALLAAALRNLSTAHPTLTVDASAQPVLTSCG